MHGWIAFEGATMDSIDNVKFTTSHIDDMINQLWVDRISASLDDDDPSVVGISETPDQLDRPMTDEEFKKYLNESP